jgi:molybdenum cofactor guanylyltransferase
MLGVVMCGGESSRMGKDKGLLLSGVKTWTETAADKLSALGIRVVASINARQENSYKEVAKQIPLVIDNPSIPAGGPLAGLLSVHAAFPGENLFILACDLPLMEPTVLKELYDRHGEANDFQAYLYTSDGEPEPLCGIYTAAALALILERLRKKGLARHSLKFVLEQLRVDSRPAPPDKRRCFTNVNSRSELPGECASLSL